MSLVSLNEGTLEIQTPQDKEPAAYDAKQSAQHKYQSGRKVKQLGSSQFTTAIKDKGVNLFEAGFTHKTKISSSNQQFVTSVPGSVKHSSQFDSRQQSSSMSPGTMQNIAAADQQSLRR